MFPARGTPISDPVFSVIADQKVRAYQKEMEGSTPVSSPRILHFSDGTLSIDDLQDDEEVAPPKQSGPVVDPNTLTWAPWVWYQTLTVGGKVLEVCDYLGGHLAHFFGITSPKYQLEIEERLAMLKEEEEERQVQLADLNSWSRPAGKSVDQMERGDVGESDVLVVSRQPLVQSGAGDAAVIFEGRFSKDSPL